MGVCEGGGVRCVSGQLPSTAWTLARRLSRAAICVGGAGGLWAVIRLIARTSFFGGAPWVDFLCVLVLLLSCGLPCVYRFMGFRWVLGVLCLLGILVLQRSELGQQALHQHGRTEHVRVLQVQKSDDGMSGGSYDFYTVSVLDAPPQAPIPGGTLVGWHWTVGGIYTVTVDPQGLAPAARGGAPGPPVLQRFLQIPLGLGLACALWRPAQLLLRRTRVAGPGLSDELGVDDADAGSAGVEGELLDPAFLVNADPEAVLELLATAPWSAGRLEGAVYRASAHLHRHAGAGVRR